MSSSFSSRNFWPCRASRQSEIRVAEKHWPSEATDPEGETTKKGEEPYLVVAGALVDFNSFYLM